MYTNPSIADFKTYFSRDFPYGTDVSTSVTDADIAKATLRTSVTINADLFPVGQEQYNIGYLLLSAHYLVTNIQMSSQGLGSQNNWLVNSKAVGNVSQGSQIPQSILDNPVMAAISKTGYGLEYLLMIIPYLNGPIFTVRGATQA